MVDESGHIIHTDAGRLHNYNECTCI